MKLPITFERAIIIVLFITVIALVFFSSPTVVVNEGITEKEHLYRLEVFKIGLENEKLQDEIQGFKNKYEKDASIIRGASINAVTNIITDRYR